MQRNDYRRPLSVLVVVHTANREVLLLQRSNPFPFWQSVTGSLRPDETHREAATRELFEETGLRDEGELVYTGVSRQFAIDPRWLSRFAPGVVENVEFEYRYCVGCSVEIRMSDEEHSAHRWLPLSEAIDLAWSWTNRAALCHLRRR